MSPKGQDGLYSERQLWQFYVRFNEVYFSNMLPLPTEIAYVERLPISKPGAVACVAWASVGEQSEGRYRILFLRPFFAGKNPHLVLCSLLHEIVHIYVLRFGRDDGDGHGPLFSEVCGRLRQLGWNVDRNLGLGIPAFGPHKGLAWSSLVQALRRLIQRLWR